MDRTPDQVEKVTALLRDCYRDFYTALYRAIENELIDREEFDGLLFTVGRELALTDEDKEIALANVIKL